MLINFYQFSKRKNSTKLPAEPLAFEAVLKDSSSIVNPMLQVDFAPYQYNYCYIPEFSRYYYFTDITWEEGLWTITLTVDVLTSWLNYIRASSAQVLFSSSNYDLNLLDNRIPAEGNIIRNVTAISFQGALANQQTAPSGTFALTVLDDSGIWATGATTTYFLSYQQMQTFVMELINPSTWEGIKQFFDNPMDAIIDCYYLPLDISGYVSLTENRAIKIGSYTFPTATGKSAQVTNMANKSIHTTISIDWPYDDFRRLSPYTRIELFIPFCGSLEISPESCYQADQLLLDYSVDVTTGAVEAIAYLKETVLGEWSGNCRVQLPMGQTQSRVDSVLGTVGGVITAAGGVASGNVALGASGVLSAIGSALTPSNQKTIGGMSGSIVGAVLGNDLMTWQKIRLSVTSHSTNATPASIRPIMGNVNGNVLSLASLSGFCQTYNASVSAPATDAELNMINQALDNGIYFE